MKSVCIIIPYFGKLPKNMYTFLLSCKYNKNINWLIFTDSNITPYENFCSNVSFVKCTLNDIKKRLILVTGTKDIKLEQPYKLCDYKPLYGLMFSDYLTGYDYWGYSDLDIVYGNLYKYISDALNEGFQKIGVRGHFTLFKNNRYVNNLYKKPLYVNNKKIYLFRDVISKSNNAHGFDEMNGINKICKQYNVKTYVNPDLVNELLWENLDLYTNDRRFPSKYSCYVWHNGHALYFYKDANGKIKNHEYGYFHFQKRKVFKYYINPLPINLRCFSITTYGYKVLNNLSNKTIVKCMEMNKSSFLKRLKYIMKIYLFSGMFTRIHIGGVYFPIKYILWRILKRKDFKI